MICHYNVCSEVKWNPLSLSRFTFQLFVFFLKQKLRVKGWCVVFRNWGGHKASISSEVFGRQAGWLSAQGLAAWGGGQKGVLPLPKAALRGVSNAGPAARCWAWPQEL